MLHQIHTMPRKCCTILYDQPCKSMYDTTDEKVTVYGFPSQPEQEDRLALSASEFTSYVSPWISPSIYLYLFFKIRESKSCTCIFLQTFKEIYDATGYNFEKIHNINRRFANCFFKAFVKHM